MTPRREKYPVDEPETVASAMEQTGLIPALPGDGEEATAYEALYPILRPKGNALSPR